MTVPSEPGARADVADGACPSENDTGPSENHTGSSENDTGPSADGVRPAPATRVLAAAGILLLAFNLRPVVNALGAVVPELRANTGLSASTVGLLLSLPTIAFAVLGLLGPGIAARIGPHRAVLVTLALLAAGQVLRAAVPGAGWLFAGSLLAFAGIAVGNVVLPGLVRFHFPDRIALVTSAYTIALTVGATVAVGLTNPIEHLLDGTWRLGIGTWSLAALIALPPWILLARRAAAVARRSGAPPTPRMPLRTVARTRVAWTLAAYFGVQAMLAYVAMGWLAEILTQRGMTRTDAALQVAVVIGVGIPPAALVPRMLGRARRPEVFVVGLAACYVAGFLGFVAARSPLAVTACSVLVGIGTAAFPVALSLIGLRSRTAPVTTTLSAFTQCVGYLIASLGPLACGALFEATGSWTPTLYLLAAASVVQGCFGALTLRRGTVEDELDAARTGP